MKRQSFIKGALILTIGGFVAKVIGALYKIPLTNILGSSGMGIYYLVFPIYNVLLVFSSGGISIAVAKLVANADNVKVRKMYLSSGVLVSLFCSTILSLLLIVASKSIAILQGNEQSYLGFVIIAPAIIFSSMVAILKSYFQGIENMTPSTISMIIEQVVKMAIGLFFSLKLLQYGIMCAVVGAIIGVTISEIVALIILVFQYATHKSLDEVKSLNENISLRNATKEIVSIAIPNTLMLLVVPLISFIDSFVVVNLLINSGFSSISATSLYGINNGIISSLISLPVIITSALSMSIVPNLSSLNRINNTLLIEDRIRFFIKITWIITLPIFIYFFIMSDKIIFALYNLHSEGVVNEFAFAEKLLRLSSISIIYNSLLSTLTSILQSRSKSYSVFMIFLISLIIRTILSCLLIQRPNINIFGIVISNIVFLFICVSCCILVLKKDMNIEMNLRKSLLTPVLSVIISGIITSVISQLFNSFNVWVNLFVSGVGLMISYIFLILLLRCFNEKDLKYLPFLIRK